MVAGCPALRAVDLRGCGNITDNGVQALAACSALDFIDLGGCDQITDAGVQALAACFELLTGKIYSRRICSI